MKYIRLIFILLLFFSCEKDDFCLQNPVTPNLVIRFYDNVDRQSVKTVQRLWVWAANKDTLDTYKGVNTDSIVIPLNTLSQETIYNLKMNNINGAADNDQLATITINYTPVEQYVSRSCGFRVVFNNVTFSPTTNTWITDFSPASLTIIDNQNAAHLQIFH